MRGKGSAAEPQVQLTPNSDGTAGSIPSDSVAQLVEQYTFNVWVLGSNPSGITQKKCLKVEAFFFSVSVWWIDNRKCVCGVGEECG